MPFSIWRLRKGEWGLNSLCRYLSYMYMLPRMAGFLGGSGRLQKKNKKTLCFQQTHDSVSSTGQKGTREEWGQGGGQGGRGGGRERRGVEHFISLSSLSPSQAFNAPFSACPALCKIMLIPLPVLSHLYKPPFLPLKSNYISLRSCQKTGLACKY